MVSRIKRVGGALLLGLTLVGSSAEAASPARPPAASSARAQRWADRLYAEAAAGLENEKGFRGFCTRRNFVSAAVAYRRVLHRWGEHAPARLGLARSLEQLAAYAPAEAAYRAVLRRQPHQREARAGLRRVQPLAATAAKVTEGGTILLQAIEVSGRGERRRWLMLSAPVGGHPGRTWTVESLQLHLVRFGDPHALPVWSGEQTSAARVPGPERISQQELEPFLAEQVYLQRLSPAGTARPVIGLVIETEIAGSADSHLHVFRLTGDRLHPVWAAGGTIGVFLTDLDRDGWREIGIWDELGSDMCHASQPRWTDRYAWDGRGYRLANARFRQTFHAVEADLYGSRADFPADPDVIARLGELHEMYGRLRAAEYAYRWSIAEYRRRVRRDRDKTWPPHDELAYVEARLGRLRTSRSRQWRSARTLPSRRPPG